MLNCIEVAVGRTYMRRKLILLLSILSICLVAFTGCTKSEQSSSEPDQSSGQEPTGGLTPTVAPIAEVQETVAEIPYNYEQELNIISDNYRNYYEIFVYSFCDSDGNGIGDFNGIISKLDYINTEMGFNGIWLMPIMPSTTYHKYDVLDYYDVDPQYGTIEDFKRLLEECEKRDIKLIIDFVFNHTSAKHPWFTQAIDYLETLEDGEEPDPKVCPYVEYYHFTKESNGSDDYHRAGSSDWYYECVFWDQMPDLALESEAVRDEIEKAAKFWLDLGVDGFRLDAAKEYFTGETGKNVEVLTWFNDYVSGVNPQAYIVGEVWDEFSAITTYYTSGMNSFFNFPLSQYDGLVINAVRKLGIGSASSLAKNLVKMQEAYSLSNPGYIDAPFISNHDTTRISAMCVNDEQQMKMSAGLLLTMSGNPFVYYGEEIGMNSSGKKDENKRLPMQWSKDGLGMTRKPTNADNVEQTFAPVEEQLADPLSILNYYKRAVRIRNENPEIARGKVTLIEALTDKNICALQKDYEGSKIVIISNINKEATAVDLKLAGYDKLSIRGYLTVDGSEVTISDGVVNMPLYSIVILK
jgi:glycosidase